MRENTPHDLLETLLKLYSDAIEYYGAQDEDEMCIDLNMRMQSVLVRPYILDALCEHNDVSKNDQQDLMDALKDDPTDPLGGQEIKTNFERDGRR